MPRPYGWIRGEGTVKNQRWGLGSIMDTPFLPSVHGMSGLGLNCPGDIGCPGNMQAGVTTIPDVEQQIADLWDSVFNLQASDNTTLSVAPTINWALIGGLALAGYLLFRR
jgi:hypothetical protein